MARHTWERVHDHKQVCVKCGLVKLHAPYRAHHSTQFERAGQFWQDKTPACDEAWPEGWKPERAAKTA